MTIFTYDAINFNYYEAGSGLPFVFQHGLGGDLKQPLEHYQPQEGVRFISFDCRGHGETRPLGSVEKLCFSCFADDLLALIDYLGLPSIVVGGISMGAGLALNFAVRHPQRVRGLILSRPAWLDVPSPPNLEAMIEIEGLIREYGVQHGRELFQQSELYQSILRDAPDTADSLTRQFEHPRAEETVPKLERLPNDAPIHDLAALSVINVPTLILANQVDPIHPYYYGEVLAGMLKGSTLKEITAKSVNKQRHVAETQQFIGEFLRTISG
jgi:pimeloyl-ACP methyl ester carboxylesterase